MKVVLKGFIIVPDSELPSVLEELPNHIAMTRRETGCLTFDVLRDTDSENRFNVYEEFDSQASFDFHQDRVKRSKWGAVSSNVERHYTIEIMDGS